MITKIKFTTSNINVTAILKKPINRATAFCLKSWMQKKYGYKNVKTLSIIVLSFAFTSCLQTEIIKGNGLTIKAKHSKDWIISKDTLGLTKLWDSLELLNKSATN